MLSFLTKTEITRCFISFTLLASGIFLLAKVLNATSFQEDNSDIDKIMGCWTFEQIKEGSGKCPTVVKDSWQLCLSPTLGGWVQGSLGVNHSEFVQTDKVSPNDVMTCIKAGTSSAIGMVNYDVDVTRTPKNELVLSEGHHKCGVGDCTKMLSTPVKGKLALNADTLILTRPDGSLIVFKKLEAKKEQK